LHNSYCFLLATGSLHRNEHVARIKLTLIVTGFLFRYSHAGERAKDSTCRRSYGRSTQCRHQYAARNRWS
jgi:hypothetical protein